MKLAALALVATATSASAQTQCAGTADVLAMFASEWGEYISGEGLSEAGLLQVLSNPDTGTWTLIISTPSGISCMVASGENWTTYPARPQL